MVKHEAMKKHGGAGYGWKRSGRWITTSYMSFLTEDLDLPGAADLPAAKLASITGTEVEDAPESIAGKLDGIVASKAKEKEGFSRTPRCHHHTDGIMERVYARGDQWAVFDDGALKFLGSPEVLIPAISDYEESPFFTSDRRAIIMPRMKPEAPGFSS